MSKLQRQLDPAQVIRNLHARVKALESVGQRSLKEFSSPGAQTVRNTTPRFKPVRNGSISTVQANLSTAPTGNAFVCKLKKNGTTIIATMTIPVGAFAVAVDVTAALAPFLATDYFTIDVTAIGTPTAGSDLQVDLWGQYQNT